jgi:hypothetical protein
MAYSNQVQKSLQAAYGRQEPVGYVFMVAQQPKGPLRPTKEEAVADAVNAREARVDLQYGRVFYNPLTWIAPVYP